MRTRGFIYRRGGSSAPVACCLDESDAFLGSEMQCPCKEFNSLPIGCPAHSALQVADPACAHARTCGQFFLCQASSRAIGSQEIAEGGNGSCCHRQRASLEFLSCADANMPSSLLIVSHSSMTERQASAWVSACKTSWSAQGKSGILQTRRIRYRAKGMAQSASPAHTCAGGYTSLSFHNKEDHQC